VVDCQALLQVLGQIASHIAAMHAAGYVHGNIKPSNILWLPRQAMWTTVDFAYACHAGSEGPAVVHTLGYAAPETVAAVQAKQSIQMDTAIDAWAVGVIAFELLYGGPALEVEGEGRAQVRSHCLLPNSPLLCSVWLQQLLFFRRGAANPCFSSFVPVAVGAIHRQGRDLCAWSDRDLALWTCHQDRLITLSLRYGWQPLLVAASHTVRMGVVSHTALTLFSKVKLLYFWLQ
jgi:serine/threonine protein kinase